MKKSGWFNDSWRHSLAARGYSTRYHARKKYYADTAFGRGITETIVRGQKIEEKRDNARLLNAVQRQDLRAKTAKVAAENIPLTQQEIDEISARRSVLGERGITTIDPLAITDKKDLWVAWDYPIYVQYMSRLQKELGKLHDEVGALENRAGENVRPSLEKLDREVKQKELEVEQAQAILQQFAGLRPDTPEFKDQLTKLTKKDKDVLAGQVISINPYLAAQAQRRKK